MKAFSESRRACICQVPFDVRLGHLPDNGCRICGCKGCHPDEILLRRRGYGPQRHGRDRNNSFRRGEYSRHRDDRPSGRERGNRVRERSRERDRDRDRERDNRDRERDNNKDNERERERDSGRSLKREREDRHVPKEKERERERDSRKVGSTLTR